MQTLATLQPLSRLTDYLEGMGISVAPTITLATSSIGSPTLTAVASLLGIEVGMLVEGPDIVPGTTVLSVGPTNVLVMSAAPTAAVTAMDFEFAFPNNAKIYLASAPLVVGDNPLISDFTQPTATWYNPVSVAVLSGPYLQPDGSGEVDCADGSWVLTTTPSAPSTIYGYFVAGHDPRKPGATDVVALWESFSTPVVMNAIGDAVVMDVPFKYPLPGTVTLIGGA